MRDYSDTVQKMRNGAGGIFYVLNGKCAFQALPTGKHRSFRQQARRRLVK
jgi:hypothetical protein